MNAMLHKMLQAPVYLYHWRCGWLFGNRFMLLVHEGRRTGRRYETVLEVMEYRKEGPEAIVMSGFGPDANWLRNIQASPIFEVAIGSQRFSAAYRILGEDEAIGVITGYERRHWLAAPIVRGALSRLLGWKYRGSDSERRRLVRQLPLVAFRPRPRNRAGRALHAL